MEKLNKDILTLIAFELDYIEILKFCLTSKKIDKYVCKNNDFWRNKLYFTYPSLKNFKSDNYKKAYNYFENVKNELMSKTIPKKLQSYERVSVLNEYLTNFLLYNDFGFIKNIPITFLTTPLIKERILNRSVALKLFIIYLHFNKLSYTEDDIVYFRSDAEINNYLDSLNLFEINRNKFGLNIVKTMVEKGFIPRAQINAEQQQLIKNKNTEMILSKINQIIS